MKKVIFTLAILGTLVTSCSSDENNTIPPVEATNFRITLTNTINYLQAKSFGAAPLTQTGQTFEVNFRGTQGAYLSFANMFAQSNDWFFATIGSGIPLWDGTTPKRGDVSNYLRVYDAGTEEEEDFLTDFPNTMYTAPNQSSPNTGPADDDNTVRDTGRNILNYLSASLSYNSNTRYFTLTITKANRDAAHNPGFVTPGILVVHAQPNALFEIGQPVRNNGLESLAEDGSPQALYDWFNEEGTTGAPLRLSSSLTPFSPGVVYAFSGDTDPLFTQGSSVSAASGLEALSEDGNPEITYNYLNQLGLSVARSSSPILPGNSLEFEIEARPGDKLSFNTMFVQSNDWFISFNNNGVALFDGNGNAVSGTDSSIQTYLFDAGTEIDETVGFGQNQPMRQGAPNTGAIDADNTIRRVGEIEDVQFGKGLIESAAGVTAHRDPRGGYNLIQINIDPIN